MRGDAHVRCGGRAGETGRKQSWYPRPGPTPTPSSAAPYQAILTSSGRVHHGTFPAEPFRSELRAGKTVKSTVPIIAQRCLERLLMAEQRLSRALVGQR